MTTEKLYPHLSKLSKKDWDILVKICCKGCSKDTPWVITLLEAKKEHLYKKRFVFWTWKFSDRLEYAFNLPFKEIPKYINKPFPQDSGIDSLAQGVFSYRLEFGDKDN